MITEQVQIDYLLTFKSAFHVGTGLRAGLIDRVVARDAAGYLYIPGSTLKGALRERCEQLASLFNLPVPALHTEDWREVSPQVDIISRVFGSRFHPGTLYFDDAHLIKEQQEWFEPPQRDKQVRESRRQEFRDRQVERRTQVSISRLTQTAHPQRLYNSEYGVRGLRFTGQIVGVLTGIALESTDGSYALLLLLAGLRSLGQLGGGKSVGVGAVDCEITSCTMGGRRIDPDALLMHLEDLEYYEMALEMEVGG